MGDQEKFQLLRAVCESPVKVFQFRAESFLENGDLRMFREVVGDLNLLREFGWVLFDLDLVSEHRSDGQEWRLYSVQPNGQIGEMDCCAPARLDDSLLPIQSVRPLLQQADVSDVVSNYKVREPTEDDADLDNCRVAKMYHTVQCVAIFRTNQLA
jgi:hypothetical protein